MTSRTNRQAMQAMQTTQRVLLVAAAMAGGLAGWPLSAAAQSAAPPAVAAPASGVVETAPAAAARAPDVAAAESFANAPASTSATADPLFAALGGRANLAAIADDLVGRLAADPKIGAFFAHTDLPELKKQLADQFCVVAGGPCVYGGANMKKAHDDLHIQRADFNRLVELLQLAMDAHDVRFADQNRFLARLAPMHRDVVETNAAR